MTGWIIFGCIVLFLVWLFTRSVTVVLDYENKLDVKVKFLFIKLYPTKPRKKKKSRRAKSGKVNNVESAEAQTAEAAPAEETAEAPAQAEAAAAEADAAADKSPAKEKKAKKEKKKSPFDLEQIVEYVKSASPPVLRLLRKIRFYELTLDYVAASGDAAATAIKYGAVCAAVYPLISWLTAYFTVHIREINIEADFSKEKDDIFAYCLIKLRVSTALGCAVWLVVRILKTYLSLNKSKNAKPVKA